MNQLSNKKEKQFTFRDLKNKINRMAERHLDKPVIIWTYDENCYTVTEVLNLEENYHHDGDCACAPKSVLKECMEEAKKDGFESDYYLIHEKGTRILIAE